MQRLRTMARFVRVLVAMFMAAQLAGVVASPLANARALTDVAAAPAHHQHAHHVHADDHGIPGLPHHHGDQSDDRGDQCCALHAFFAGVLPPVVGVATEHVVGVRLSAELTDGLLAVARDRLDRPPRSALI
jgi:hypothetical protein